MTLTLYLLRHGQTTLSRNDSFCGSGLDPELTPEGLEMAHAFAAAYSSKPWRAIYSSPMRRTLASALPLAELLEMKIDAQDDLREIAYGKWEGLTKEQVEREYPDDFRNWLKDPARHPPTGGELATSRWRAAGVADR